MAGIGFELNRLFQKKGVFSNIRACIYSMLVTIGPTILCIFFIIGMSMFMRSQGVAVKIVELIQATIMYSFMGALILTSGYCILLSRYLEDQIYNKKYENILPSLYGAIVLVLGAVLIISYIFYKPADLPVFYKGLASLLFLQVSVQLVLGCYTSVLKNYKKISFAFIVGMSVGSVIYILAIWIQGKWHEYWCLISINSAFLVINWILIHQNQSYFIGRSHAYFKFLSYLKMSKWAVLSNVFWVVGLYSHNIIMWQEPGLQVQISNAYVFAPQYDTPAFFAFLTVLPSLVIFVVKLETSFLVKYNSYFKFINQGACYQDIQWVKKDMKKALSQEILYLMQMQLIFTIGGILIGMLCFRMIGFTLKTIYLFSILCLGYYCSIIMFIIMTILLYFEDGKGASMTTGLFFVVTSISTIVTLSMGSQYYGIGLFIGGMSSLVVGLVRIKYFIKNINYYIFCKYSNWSE